MKDINIFIYNKTWLESGMANIVQTLHMAESLNRNADTTIFLRSKSENSEKIIENIISKKPKFNSIVRNQNSFVHFLSCLYILSLKSRSETVFYSRTVIMCILANLFGFNAVLELHQDKFGRSEFISKYFAKILNSHYFKSKIKLVVISESLKSIIIKKYMIQNTIFVSHDAANMPPKTFLNMSKRNRKLVVYTGKFGNDRSVDHILDLAMSDPESDFRIIGGSPNEVEIFRKIIEKVNLKNLKVFKRQKYSRIRYFQCKADILIAFWSSEVPTMEYCSPLKLFEYMQTGNKILLHDFKVFNEVIPTNNLIRKCIPDNKDSEIKEYKYLKNLEYTEKDKLNLISYASKYTYDNRARNIYEFIKI